jgi:uncharacterized protein (DUF2141 family)
MQKTVLLALLLCLFWGEAKAGQLIVTLTGKEITGKWVYVGVLDDADNFPSGKAVVKAKVQAEGDTLEVTLPPVPPGAYAVSAFCDMNGNGELDSSIIGKPTEPYGFSRNARGRFGPPDWDDAVVEMGEDVQRLEIKLK